MDMFFGRSKNYDRSDENNNKTDSEINSENTQNTH